MSKILTTILFVMTLVGLFGLVDYAMAQTCCIASERETTIARNPLGKVELSENSPFALTGCRLEPASGCKTAPEFEYNGNVFTSIQDVFNFLTTGGISAIISSRGQTQILTSIERKETSVSCLSQPRCGSAIAAETNCEQFNGNTTFCLNASSCFPIGSACYSRYSDDDCPKLTQNFCGTPTGNQVCQWRVVDGRGGCFSRLEAELADRYGGSSRLLPSCALAGVCRDVNDLLSVAIKIAQFLFSMIGGVAFLVFVLGGVRMITSFGNAEKIKGAQQMLVAAVVGLIIAFSAIFLIDFLLDSLNVGNAPGAEITADQQRGI